MEWCIVCVFVYNTETHLNAPRNQSLLELGPQTSLKCKGASIRVLIIASSRALLLEVDHLAVVDRQAELASFNHRTMNLQA